MYNVYFILYIEHSFVKCFIYKFIDMVFAYFIHIKLSFMSHNTKVE